MAKKVQPDYIFESSWEVCNMVGGIYTVLSTRAATLLPTYGDKLIFIGPDVWTEKESPYFEEDGSLLAEWKQYIANTHNLPIRIGRWKIPGNPIAVLVSFQGLMEQKNEIYGKVWETAYVDSLQAYGDYDEASMFGYASGMVIDSYYDFFKLKKKDKVVAHFNEWMNAFGIFYLRANRPEIANIFTTHATSIGRSIAGNKKPLYNYLKEYNGDQMAQELNMVAKHSAEKQAAHFADAFTTVSQITARECEQLLDKMPDVVTPNGWEDDFIPKGKLFNQKRKEARASLQTVAEAVLGYQLPEDVQFVATAGRYEFKNKGIDVYLEAMKHLNDCKCLKKQIVAFVMVPAWIKGAREDLAYALQHPEQTHQHTNNRTTHVLHEHFHDKTIKLADWFHLKNTENEQVKLIFVPAYLNGEDGIFNKTYYDLLIGMDMTIFPSYYEPWGYTPLESIAFHVPTITTSLAGFGNWVSESPQDIELGVGVIERSDYNGYEVSLEIAEMLKKFVNASPTKQNAIRKKAAIQAEKALWKYFIHHYEDAYAIALKNTKKRLM